MGDEYYKREDVEQKEKGETMRPIDADALKNLAEKVACCGLIDLDVLKIMIDYASTIDAVPKWIPCEERLPENESTVLVTDANGHIRHAFYDAECDWFGTYEESMTIRAIAWMPLPEPYREEARK